MISEQRNPKRLRRQRDVLLETVSEVARIECRRLTGSPSPEFRHAVDALEDFDAGKPGAHRDRVLRAVSQAR